MVFVEYVMLAGINDSFAQAAQLADILDPRMFKVNLIPYNPTGSAFTGSSPEGDRGVQGRARAPRIGRHRPPHPRARHRRRVRSARGAVARRSGRVSLNPTGGRRDHPDGRVGGVVR